MQCWMTRLRARCGCGCKFEAFSLPAEEAQGKWIARTRSGFAAFLIGDPELFAAVQAAGSVADQGEVARLVALVGDTAPDGEPYDTGLDLVCPRCGSSEAEVKVDKQLPEIVVGLPVVTHNRWRSAPEVQRVGAVQAALRQIAAAHTKVLG